MKIPLRYSLVLALAVGFTTTSVFASVDIDWVVIGNTGNAAQSAANRTHGESGGDGLGSVAHTYRIARNETTIADYVQFLNAAAASDPHGLYSPNMELDTFTSGISRSGSEGSYTYAAIGSAARPMAHVSWFDAARFANWLHHDQPSGALAVGLIEGGAYTLNGATSGLITKNADAKVWIPTENEWYKAAYYDPNHMSGAGGYWLHANQNNSMTSNNPSDPGAANYYNGVFAVSQSGTPSLQNYLTDVGAYGADSASFYGINDMAGNLWEWNDLEWVNDFRGLRGGVWYNGYDLGGSSEDLASQSRWSGSPDSEGDWTFRLAGVPEPTSLILTALAGCAFVLRRNRSFAQ